MAMKLKIKSPWPLRLLVAAVAGFIIVGMTLSPSRVMGDIWGRLFAPQQTGRDAGALADLGAGSASKNEVGKNSNYTLGRPTNSQATVSIRSIYDRYPKPLALPIGRLVGAEVSAAQAKISRKIDGWFNAQKMGDAYLALLPLANGGDAEAMHDLADIIGVCDSPIWRSSKKGALMSPQCDVVPKNAQAEAMRWMALAAKEGHLLAIHRHLYLTGGAEQAAKYAAVLATDPVLNGLVQEQLLASIQYFTQVPERGYLEQGREIYTNGLVPPNQVFAAAYQLADYSLQTSVWPVNDNTTRLGSALTPVFEGLSASQQSAAIAKAAEILKHCCNQLSPALDFAKHRKP